MIKIKWPSRKINSENTKDNSENTKDNMKAKSQVGTECSKNDKNHDKSGN